jgi:hypothetical protein
MNAAGRGEATMNLKTDCVWQIAAGDTERNYAPLCLRWDVVLMGPGRFGPWNETAYTPGQTGDTTRKIAVIRRFCEEIRDGDLVVLRIGTSSVCGVGVVVGDTEWNDRFGDVDGWDLQHVRRVKWLWKQNTDFSTYALKWGDTVQRLTSEPVLDWIRTLEIPDSEMAREIADFPRSAGVRRDTSETIAEYLFDHGIASQSIRDLTNEIAELSRIAKWYQSSCNPSEPETVAYLVIPLLRALGWTPQKMAIEWRKVDIALFRSLPRDTGNLAAVVEAKRKGLSCLTAKSQAQGYAEKYGSALCRRLIVTDGLRYAVFFRTEQGFEEQHRAYLNLADMRSEYPVYECGGAKEAFLLMSSDWTAPMSGAEKAGDGSERRRFA